ncbi:phosphatidylserine synthase 1-like [Dendronephthya gigantea]|uniref:phosphatidylserine synthase 1-like n=1 Tax=Dendronephthya gigantea TaxID=151771 RepID=UPI00106A48A5|nr:phosphatidylserine synthase 1-like [Dendronephthya gigantea]
MIMSCRHVDLCSMYRVTCEQAAISSFVQTRWTTQIVYKVASFCKIMVRNRGDRSNKRERTFSSSSTVSTDDGHHDLSEQIVLDVTLEYFYKPRTLTALGCLLAYLGYFAFTHDPDVELSKNIFKGCIAISVAFLFVCMLVAPNGPFTRPHPLLWRIVFGISVIYLLGFTFLLFLNYDQIKNILVFIDDDLKHAGPDMKEYATDCRLSWAKLYDSMDLFILSHFIGWAGKSLLMRHAVLCWSASITWEITEIFFAHLLPNFKECWWDAILLDIVICNGLGIHVGLYLCKKLEMRTYHWESIKDIQSTTGKLRRAILQFTPASWTRVSWTDSNSTYKRLLCVYILGLFWQIVELNTFFLKHIFRIPNPHPLNICRLLLISLISAPTIRQYYIFVTDTRTKRMGTQCWVFIAITIIELLMCIKFGKDLFAKTEKINIVMWLLFQLVFSFLIVCVMIIRRNRNAESESRGEALASLPSDEKNKAYNYVSSNGRHVVRPDGPSASPSRVTRSMAKVGKGTVDDRGVDRRK